MGVISFWTTAKVNLLCLSYILHNLESLVMDFNTVTCCVTEVLLFIDIKRGKDNTKNRNYLRKLGQKKPTNVG